MVHRIPVLLLLVLLAANLTGCSMMERDEVRLGNEEGVIEGRVSMGFEVASFTPCDQSESWWLGGGAAAADLQARYTDLAVRPYTDAYARVRGEVSGPGQYGHLGAYEREIEVVEVLDVRTLSRNECQ